MENSLKEEILYTTDELARFKYLKTDYKKHEKWKKRKNVRIILALIILLSIPFSFFATVNAIRYNSGFNMVLFMCYLGGSAFMFGLPHLFYYKMLQQTCTEGIDKVFNEHIYISDSSLRYVKSRHINERRHPVGEEIEYKFIKRIVYDQERSRLYIYGKKKEIRFTNYLKDKNECNWIYNKHHNANMRIVLFYNGNENIVETLKKYSPIEMEMIDNFVPIHKGGRR